MDALGKVTQVNDAASEVLGICSGLGCQVAVGAKAHGGRDVCTPNCAASIAAGVHAMEPREVIIRGQPAQLFCSQVGEEVVVVVSPRDEPDPFVELLTSREQEVLTLVARGCTTRQIAELLEIRPATVRTHVEHAREKLGAVTRAEAVARALVSGQIQ